MCLCILYTVYIYIVCVRATVTITLTIYIYIMYSGEGGDDIGSRVFVFALSMMTSVYISLYIS